MHLGVIYMTNHQSAVRGRPTPLTHWRSQPRLSQRFERPRAIRAARAHLLILPPYSPDLNPIEQAFAKIKHRLWNAAARSWEALWRAVIWTGVSPGLVQVRGKTRLELPFSVPRTEGNAEVHSRRANERSDVFSNMRVLSLSG